MPTPRYVFPDRENLNQGVVVDQSDSEIKCLAVDGAEIP